MKRINLLLTPILGLSSIASLAIPMTSCSQETTSHIKYEGAKHFAISAGDTVDIDIVLDKIYAKEDIKSIELKTEVDNFFSYTYDINDTVLTIHLKQTARVYEENKEYELEVKIITSSWTEAVTGIKFNYTISKDTSFRAWAFEKTRMTYKNTEGFNMKYSTDGKTWTDISEKTTQPVDVTIEAGQSIWLKGNNETTGLNGFNLCFYNANEGREDKPSIDLLGNLNSLIFGDKASSENELPSDAFFALFAHTDEQKSSINYVSENLLPSTTLSISCYNALFWNCSNLLNAPKLPATKLPANCYAIMFNGCKSLTTAPTLEAEKLDQNCYDSMFCDCENLIVAPSKLPAQTLVNGCYSSMFQNCKKLAQAPQLQAKTLAPNCYMYMFDNCTSLVNAPSLPVTAIPEYCYFGMFRGCKSLKTAPKIVIDSLEEKSHAFENMFNGCSSLEVSDNGQEDNAIITIPNDAVVANHFENMFVGTKIWSGTDQVVPGSTYYYK